VPAGCVFWQLAATRTFVTTTKDYELCSIGCAHSPYGAAFARPIRAELKQALEAMSGLDYVREEEVRRIPVVQREVKQC